MLRQSIRQLSLRKLPCRSKENITGNNNVADIRISEKNTIENGEKNIVDPASPQSPEGKATAKRMGKAQQRDAFTELLVLKGANGGRLKRGQIRNIVKKYNKRGYPYVTEENLHYRLKLMRKGRTTLDAPITFRPRDVLLPKVIALEEITETSTLTAAYNCDNSTTLDLYADLFNEPEDEEIQTSRNKGVRKKGQTIAAKEHYKTKSFEALTEATNRFAKVKEAAKLKGAALPKGTISKIISEVESEYTITPGIIKAETIRSRIKINNLSGKSRSRTSPLEDIEGVLVDFCIRLARMGQGLTREEVIELAEDLISETEHAEKMKYFKEIRHLENNGLGLGWYKGFLNRHKGLIKPRKSRIQDSNRSTWCTYNNFSNMYDEVYEMMVTAGVAEKLEKEIMMDANGNEVTSESEMYGRKTKYKVTKPDHILFVDETGSNTNQKEDGLVGGQCILVGTNQTEGGSIGSTTDMHFTVLCFTSGTGEPVMCGIILKSEKHISELSLEVTLGVDITKDPLTGINTSELFEMNSDEHEGAMHGGPVCHFQGKQLPCFIATSPKASITAEILVEMLRSIDTSGVFDRSTGTLPFLLLDGHGSRTRIPFIKYITNEEHEWMVCCGVPYRTHLWQVADSSELNGCFKMQLTKAKKNYRKYKPINRKSFETTDIVPLVRQAWDLSFGRAHVAKKAIAARGWGPLNYILLDHPALIHFKSSTLQRNNQLKKSIEVNLEGAITGSHLDAIFEDDKLCKSRQVAWEESKLKDEDRETRFKRLKDVGLLTVGKLTKQGLHTLSRPEILKHVQDHEHKRYEEKQKVEHRQFMSNVKFQTKVSEAVKRYKKNERLRYDDIKVLMKKYNSPGDSPLRKTIAEAKQQWEKRGEQRLKEQLVLYSKVEDNLDSSDDESAAQVNNDCLLDESVGFENRTRNTLTIVADTSTITSNNCNDDAAEMNFVIENNNELNVGGSFEHPFDSLVLLSSLASDKCERSLHVEL